jgi:hypothetical protein
MCTTVSPYHTFRPRGLFPPQCALPLTCARPLRWRRSVSRGFLAMATRAAGCGGCSRWSWPPPRGAQSSSDLLANAEKMAKVQQQGKGG